MHVETSTYDSGQLSQNRRLSRAMRTVTWGRPLYKSHKNHQGLEGHQGDGQVLPKPPHPGPTQQRPSVTCPPRPAGRFPESLAQSPSPALTALTSAMRRARGARVPTATTKGTRASKTLARNFSRPGPNRPNCDQELCTEMFSMEAFTTTSSRKHLLAHSGQIVAQAHRETWSKP